MFPDFLFVCTAKLTPPQINQLACIRLTERCANILISVREEIVEIDRLAHRSPPSTNSSPSAHHHIPPGLEKHPHSDPGTPLKAGSNALNASTHRPSPLSSAEGYHSDEGATPRMREGHKELSGGSMSVAGRQSLNSALATPMEKLNS